MGKITRTAVRTVRNTVCTTITRTGRNVTIRTTGTTGNAGGRPINRSKTVRF